MKATQKLIDRMPKIMHAIIDAEGFKNPYRVVHLIRMKTRILRHKTKKVKEENGQFR